MGWAPDGFRLQRRGLGGVEIYRAVEHSRGGGLRPESLCGSITIRCSSIFTKKKSFSRHLMGTFFRYNK